MNPTLRMILAVVAGIIVGNIVNGGLIMLSPMLIPPPEGVDPTNAESLAANMHLFEARHFIVPFLAHALGTLAAAFLAAKLTPTRKMRAALIVGGFFLLAGIANLFILPGAPVWFVALDVILAYIPMGWLGWKLADKKTAE